MWRRGWKEKKSSRFFGRLLIKISSPMATLFRVDGSGEIGMGHIVRSSALAEGLKETGEKLIFVTRRYDGKAAEFLNRRGWTTEVLESRLSLREDWKATLEGIARNQADTVVTDSYDIDESYLRVLKKSGVFLVTLDDQVKLNFPSDLIINQNLGFTEEQYRKTEAAQLLLGPKFAILRNEFRMKRSVPRPLVSRPQQILVTFGGGEEGGLSGKVVRALLAMKEDFKITVVLGPAHSRKTDLKNLEKQEGGRVEVKENVQEMAELMHRSDLAVCAGGTTCWELACLGVPALIFILADNQKKNSEELDRLGCAVHLGPAESFEEKKLQTHLAGLLHRPEKIKAMSGRNQALVDGLGVQRIVKVLKGARQL